MSTLRRRPWWAVLFLAVQIATPAWQLTKPRPARFGWQMYAGAPLPPAFIAVMPDGAHVLAPLDQYIVRSRDDLDVRRYLPPAICARTGAAAVRYVAAPGQAPIEIACRR
jgi:hypothetical protein